MISFGLPYFGSVGRQRGHMFPRQTSRHFSGTLSRSLRFRAYQVHLSPSEPLMGLNNVNTLDGSMLVTQLWSPPAPHFPRIVARRLD